MPETPSTAPDPTATPDPTGVPPVPDAAATAPPAAPDADKPETFDRAYVEKLRAEAAENRTKARDAEAAGQAKITAALEALGIKPKDDEDPLAAAQQLAQANEARAAETEQALGDARRELAIYKAAGTLGADVDLLLDSTSFLTATKGIDPGDGEAINAAISKALENNPRFRSVQAADANGSDFTGGSGEGAVTQARFDAMTPAEKNTLYQTDPTRYRQLAGH